MKNLKKAFSLVLAAAMMCSLLVINAGAADYSDDASITHTEAVSVMSQLNIIGGYTDGSFQPTKVVTRAEMCKMLCVALNGGTDPILGSDSLSIFSDTTGHWANAYIAYCYNLGIVNGDAGAGGTFRPDATVTGAEAAKMMLVSLGYNSAFAGFTGADWALNVAVVSNQKGLFKDITSLTLNTGLTRDNAAQLIYNGINTNMVEYDNVLSTNAGGQLTATVKIKDVSPAATIISDNYGATKYTAILLANENGFFAGAKQDAGYTWVDIDGDAVVDAATETFKVTTSADLLGQKVTMYVKTSTTQTSKYWTVCGAPIASSDNKIVSFTSSKAGSQTQTQFDDAMKALGISTYTSATVVENYGGNANSWVAGPITSLAAAFALRSNANGIQVSFIDNDGDKDVEYVSVIKLAVGKVATYSTTGDGYVTVTALAGSNANVPAISGEKFSNVVGVDSIAKDDIVTYYKMGTKWYVTECASVTANVTSTSSPNVTASGTTYKPANLATAFNASAAASIVASVTLGKDATFYTDAYGFVVYVGEVVDNTKFAVVLASNDATYTALDSLKAKLVFEDGTISTVTVSKIASVAVPSTGSAALLMEIGAASGVIYNYTKLTDGTYNLTAATGTLAYPTAVTKNVPTIGAAVANSNSIFVMGNAAATSFTATTGIANVGTTTAITANNAILLYNSSNTALVMFAFGGTGSASNAKYIYVLNTTPTVSLDSDSANVYTYKTVINGVYTDLVVTGAAAADAFTAKGMYRVDNTGTTELVLASNGKLSVTAKLTNVVASADATYCANGVITGQIVNLATAGSTAGALTYDDNTKVLILDGNTVTAGSISDVAVISGSSSSTSDILITRASAVATDSGYNIAGVVYICK